MTINANNKIIGTALTRTQDYKLVAVKEIKDLTELEQITEKGLGQGGYGLSLVKLIHNFYNAKATEYTYENGLKFLLSEITYRDKLEGNNIHTIKQYTFTTNYEEAPLINIVVTREQKSVQQLIAKSYIKDENIPECERNIEIFETIPYVNNTCGHVFKAYTDMRNNTLLMETYMQYYTISENAEKGLLSLCGVGEKIIEIIYSKKQPVSTNFAVKERDKSLPKYQFNSELGAQFVVDAINVEVDAIVEKINSIFNDYEKKYNNQKRLKK